MSSEVGKSAGPNVLLIEDDQEYGTALKRALSEDCRDIEQVASCEDAMEALAGRETYFDAIILDHGLEGNRTGIDCLRALMRMPIVAEVIMLTGLGTRRLGVEALREGAFRYFTKQSENDEELICALMVAYDIARAKRANSRWKKTGEELNNSLILIILVAALALLCVVVLNWVASENFFASVVAVVSLVFVLLFGAFRIRRFKMAWKEGGQAGSLEAVGAPDADHGSNLTNASRRMR